MSFVKKKENFVCEVCGTSAKGTGYTDHCPNCLFSKHVDVSPGDRQAKCQGLMEPVSVSQKGKQWNIQYQCLNCGLEKQNKAAKNDNMEKIILLTAHPLILKE